MKITAKVTDSNPVHSRLSVWVDGALIVHPGGICLKNEEVEGFLDHLKISPTKIKAKIRAMMEHYWKENDRVGQSVEGMMNTEKRVALQVVLSFIEQEERELNLDIGTWELK